MRISLLSVVLPALMLAACASAPPSPPTQAQQAASIRLIAFNDFHGNIDPPGGGTQYPDASGKAPAGRLPTGGAAYLATAVQRLEQGHPEHLLVAAGDLVGASPLDSSLFHDEPTIEVLNRIGLAVSSVGNHEFDQGVAELLRKQNGGCYPGGKPGEDTCVDGPFSGARFTYLSANVIDKRDGRTLFPSSLIETFMIDGRPVKIGFIGLVLRETPTMVSPDGVANLRFLDEVDSANTEIPVLEKLGVHAFVVLIHQGGRTTGAFHDGPTSSSWFDDHSCPGFTGDLQAILDGLDPKIRVVISGHTHQAYVCRFGDRLVTSAGLYGRLLTAIDLDIDPLSGMLVDARADNVPVVNGPAQPAGAPAPASDAPLPPDPAVAKLVATYDDKVKPIAGRVVGRITADFGHVLDPNGNGENAIGDLVADAALAATRKAGAQLAVYNAGGVRAPLRVDQISAGEAPGEITYGEAHEVLPFNNELITMSLSGAQLETLLSEQWVGQKQMHPLAVSSTLHYRWDNARPDGTDKLVPGSLMLDGKPVQPDAQYRVTVNSFMASGGDGTVVLAQGRDRTVGGGDLAAFVSYLQSHSPLTPAPATRVERLN